MQRSPHNTVLIAMSGGMDSTMAALLLQNSGYQLLGCTFRTRYTSDEQLQIAVDIAQRLGIRHYILDLSESFEKEVVQHFRDEYMAGRTPNPCVVCNRCIKFGVLLEEAKRFNCQYIATGHYARVAMIEGHYFLRRAKDVHKDQTYFLWQLSEEQLSHCLFPLGEKTKDEVRTYLLQHGWGDLTGKGESQDICFIESDYRSFLQLPISLGKFVDAQGNVIGMHNGYTHFTIGQRKGLGISIGHPAYVTHIDALSNEVRLGQYADLYQDRVALQSSFFRGDISRSVMAQIRYRSFPSEAVYDGNLLFSQPVWAVTPGQSAVLYQDDVLVGGGIIADTM